MRAAWSLLGAVYAAWLRRAEGPCAFTVFNDLSPDRGRTLSTADVDVHTLFSSPTFLVTERAEGATVVRTLLRRPQGRNGASPAVGTCKEAGDMRCSVTFKAGPPGPGDAVSYDYQRNHLLVHLCSACTPPVEPRAFLPTAYLRTMAGAAMRAWPEQPKAASLRMLNLGHGAGALPGLLRRAGASVTSVDVDPDVARVAPCFGWTGDVVVADGRAELARAGSSSLDVVTVDVVDSASGAVPACFATVDFFTDIASKLRPGGRAIMNVPPEQLPAVASAVLAASSWRVEVAQVPPPTANFVLVAVAAPWPRGETRDLIPDATEWVRATQWTTLKSAPSDALTTDATSCTR